MTIKEAVLRQSEYIREQQEIQRELQRVGYREQLPPCCSCSPFTFCSCEDAENPRECGTFLIYAEKGRIPK